MQALLTESASPIPKVKIWDHGLPGNHIPSSLIIQCFCQKFCHPALANGCPTIVKAIASFLYFDVCIRGSTKSLPLAGNGVNLSSKTLLLPGSIQCRKKGLSQKPSPHRGRCPRRGRMRCNPKKQYLPRSNRTENILCHDFAHPTRSLALAEGE